MSQKSINELLDDARKRQQQYTAQLQQLQAAAQQLVGNLNKVAGEIEVLDKILGDNDGKESAA